MKKRHFCAALAGERRIIPRSPRQPGKKDMPKAAGQAN
jgi:hypothetical protein